MSSENTNAGQSALGKLEVMGVASVCSKRRLENGEVSNEQDSPASKIAKKNPFPEPYPNQQDPIVHETSSSEFLTTSILARTLLTGSGGSSSHHESLVHVPAPSAASPLDSLKFSLEGMPAPTFLESLHELGGGRFHGRELKSTIEESTELEFTNLLCHETSLATVTILSPIDEDSGEWRSGGSLKHKGHTSSTLSNQVITEAENGKSYFNLGPSDATVLAKKSSANFASSDQSWLNANGGDIDMDDTSSSSSCDSISSEDLFNSCEEFDPSEDEEEVRTYKQERSTVLHLSLCKLNMFRTHCLEPSLRRSVLICNTLRHIEQEIRSEDEDKTTTTCISLESRETLPPFWPSAHLHRTPPQHPRPEETLPVPDMSPHDPYLSSNSYSNESPYTSYDYNSLRPSQTPFHSTSYDDYPDSDLGGVIPSPILTELVSNSSNSPTMLECGDSGYAEDMELSSYYYGGSPASNEFSTTTVVGMEQGYCTQQQQQEIPQGSTHPVGVATGGTSETSTSVGGDSGDINSTLGLGQGLEINGSCSSRGGKYGLDGNNGRVGAGAMRDIQCWTSATAEMTPTSQASTSSHAHTAYPHQEGQCGLESRRSDYGGYNGHQQLPMDSLVSATYSSLS